MSLVAVQLAALLVSVAQLPAEAGVATSAGFALALGL